MPARTLRIVLMATLLVAGSTRAQEVPGAVFLGPGMSVTGEGYGRSVATDGVTAVVGAPAAESFGGRAYLFRRTGNETWTFLGTLAPDSPKAGEFGSAVAVQGDLVVVGAPKDESGAVYLFRLLPEDDPELLEEIRPEGVGLGTFGTAIVIAGEDLLVGAPQAGFSRAGAVFVHREDGGEWNTVQIIEPVSLVPFGRFGDALAADDATGTLVVGAPGGEGGAEGFAYVFSKDAGGGWVLEERLVSPIPLSDPPGEVPLFGEAVAVRSGRALIGAPAAGSGDIRGAAFVYDRTGDAPGATWSFVGELPDPAPTPTSNFGQALSMGQGWAAAGVPGRMSVMPQGAVVFYDDPGAGGATPSVVFEVEGLAGSLGEATAAAGPWLIAGGPLDDPAGEAVGFDTRVLVTPLEPLPHQSPELVRLDGPNPTRGPLRLRLQLEQPELVEITLYDVLGRQIGAWTDRLPAGDHAVELGAPRVLGTIICSVRAGRLRETVRFTVL
jgi:hypothetical protein